MIRATHADRRLVWLGVPLALLLLGPALHGDRTLVGADLFTFDLPRLEALSRAWRAGHVPGWSPHVGHGQPFLADPCFAAHYPGHALLLLLPPVQALTWLLLLHLALAHAGAYRLARALGLGPAAAALAGVVYAGGGVAQSHVHSPCFLLGMAWLPWAVLGAWWALEPGAPRRRLTVAAAPFALIYLGGAPEFAALAGALAWAVAAGRGRGLARATTGLVVVAALAVALAASTLVPFLAVAGETDRAAGLAYAAAARWSLHPLELPGLLVAQPFAGGGLPAATIGHVGRAWYPSIYVGAAPAALLALGALAARRDARARLLLLAAAPFLLYALGEHGPLHPLLFEHAPAVRSFRYPAKAFVPVALCAALLVGVGLERARARPAALAVALAAAAVLSLAAGAVAWREAPALTWRAATTAAFAGVALVLWRVRPQTVARGGLVLLALLDLGVASRGVIEVAPAAVYAAPPALLGHVAAEQADGAPRRVATLESAFAARGVGGPGLGPEAAAQRGWREALLPNTGMSVGVRTASGFSSFTPGRLAALRAAAREVDMPRYLRLLGAGLVVHAQGDPTVARDAAPVAAVGPWVLARLSGAPPWAVVHGAARRADGPADAAAQVAAPEFDPARAGVVEGAPSLPANDGPVGVARALRLEDDLVALAVDARADGLLVVREGWGRGWRAEVDGRPAPVLPADALFRAVPVPAGRHEVTLRYEAPLRAHGAALGLVAWAALLAAALAGRRRAA